MSQVVKASSLQKHFILSSLSASLGSDGGKENIAQAFRLSPDLEPPLLEQAWSRVVEAHSILTARFVLRDSELYCVSRPWHQLKCTIRRHKLDDEAELHSVMDALRREHFAVSEAGPLWRLDYLSAPQGSWLLVTFHHAIADLRTFAILFTDFSSALSGALPASRRTDFTDYLEWSEGRDLTPFHIEFQKMADLVSGQDDLVAEHTSTNGISRTKRQIRQEIILPERLDEAAMAVCTSHGFNWPVPFLAAWALTLAKISNQSGVVFGNVRSGTHGLSKNYKGVAGPLAHTVPFPIRINPETSIAELLAHVQKLYSDMSAFDTIPTDQLLDWMGAPDHASLLSTHVHFTRPLQAYSGLRLAPSLSLGPTLRNDARVPVLVTTLDHGRAQFLLEAPESHAEFCRHAQVLFSRFLAAIVMGEGRVCDIAMPEEPAEPAVHGPRQIWPHATLAEMLDSRLTADPETLAIDGSARLTYEALDTSSRQLSSAMLRARQNTGPVVICLPAGVAAVVSIIAAGRAGIPFLCVNYDEPPINFEAALATLTPSLLVLPTSGDAPKGVSGYSCLRVAEDGSTPDGEQMASQLRRPAKDDDCYLVMTSGTTGMPKILRLVHHGAANALFAIIDASGLGPGSRRLHTAKPGTDFYISEVLSSLCSGATLVIDHKAMILSPGAYIDRIRQLKVSVIGMASSFWRLLVDYIAVDPLARFPACLRHVNIGMEAADSVNLANWQGFLPAGVSTTNFYGPAEATMVATIANVTTPDCILHNRSVSAGAPIANMSVLVLDSLLRPLPRGETGQICLAGPGVMSGIVGFGELTALTVNPFARGPEEARLLLTGDLGYLDDSGNLTVVGRTDRMVKVRGHRVELDGLEAILASLLPGASTLAEAIFENGRNKLVFFSDAVEAVDSVAFTRRIADRLPQELVPHAICRLAEVPRLNNGKVDRQSLVRIYRDRAEVTSAEGQASAGGTLEDQVIDLWNRALMRSDCDKNSDFFDFGGDSLKAMELSVMFEERLGRELTLDLLYRFRTPAGVSDAWARAALLPAGSNGAQSTGMTGNEAVGAAIYPDVPASLFQSISVYHQGWIGHRLHPRSPLFIRNEMGTRPPVFWCFQGEQEFASLAMALGPDQPLVGMRSAHLAATVTTDVVRALGSRYAAEIDRVSDFDKPLILGGNCQSANIALAMAGYLRSWGRQVDSLILLNLVDFYSYPDPVELMYGADEPRMFRERHGDFFVRLDESYPAGWTLHRVAGGHGKYFAARNVPSIAAVIAAIVDQL